MDTSFFRFVTLVGVLWAVEVAAETPKGVERLDQIGQFHLGQSYEQARKAAGLPKLKDFGRILGRQATKAELAKLGLAKLDQHGEPNTTFSVHLTREHCELLFGPVAQPAPGEGESGLCGFNFSMSAAGVFEVSMIFARLHVADRIRYREGYIARLGKADSGRGARLTWFDQHENAPFRIDYVEDTREGVYRIEVSSRDLREGARRRAHRGREIAVNGPIRNLLPVIR
jgi:hypothetical protein